MTRLIPQRGGRVVAGAALAALALGACGSTTKAAAPTTTTTTSTPTTFASPSSTAGGSTTSAATSTTTASSGTTTTAAGGSAPACATDELTIATSGPTDAGAGSVSYPITFTDAGPSPCTLYGYPGVSAVTTGGQTIGQPANKVSNAASPATLTLAPHASATAVLRVAQAGNFDPSACGTPQTPAALRVFPPGQTASVNVAFSVPVCPGPAQQLHINPIASS